MEVSRENLSWAPLVVLVLLGSHLPLSGPALLPECLCVFTRTPGTGLGALLNPSDLLLI